jgi:hypothetical protein
MKAGMSADEFVSLGLYHRTMETIYDIIQMSDERGLKATREGLAQARATLILISRQYPGKFPIPFWFILPKDV